jgi:hypothetical protein
MIRIGFDGQVCAVALPDSPTSMSMIVRRVHMAPSLSSDLAFFDHGRQARNASIFERRRVDALYGILRNELVDAIACRRLGAEVKQMRCAADSRR